MTCAGARALASLALDGELDELGSRQLRGNVARYGPPCESAL